MFLRVSHRIWEVTVNLPANTFFEYKFIGRQDDGSVSVYFPRRFQSSFLPVMHSGGMGIWF